MITAQKTVSTAPKEERKATYLLLISKLPRGFGYAPKVAQLLKKTKTLRGSTYTSRIVYDIIHQGHNDWRVEKALAELNEDYFELPIESIYPGYTPPKQFRSRLAEKEA